MVYEGERCGSGACGGCLCFLRSRPCSAAVAALTSAVLVMAAIIALFLLGWALGVLQWAGLAVITAGLVAGTAWPMLRKPQPG